MLSLNTNVIYEEIYNLTNTILNKAPELEKSEDPEVVSNLYKELEKIKTCLNDVNMRLNVLHLCNELKTITIV